MGVYRKKPVAIEAIQYTGLNGPEIAKFIGVGICEREEIINGKWVKQFEIRTLEGPHIATQGDYIIKGVAGEHYPCKPDIFGQTYEAAEIAEGPPDWMAKAISLYTDLRQITEKFDNAEMKEFAELCETVNLIASCKG